MSARDNVLDELAEKLNGGGAPEDFDDDPAGGGGTPRKNP